jgi:hypothetical protein
LLLLAAAMAISAAILVVLGSKVTFVLDDWTYILYRRDFSADAFLMPANEHLVGGAVATWKLLLESVGISSTTPYRVVSTAMFLLGNWFLFVWIRRRLGAWPALFATVPMLFIGAAYEDLFWFSSITFLGSLTCGLGMLVALDRRDRTGDLLALAWLLGTMLFSSLWIPFALGVAVDIFLRRGERDWRRRAYVVVVPAVLWALWWLGWGHEAEGSISLHNIAATPIFVLDSFAAALAALFGLATPVSEGMPSPSGLDWGRPLAVGLGGLALWRAYKIERIPRSLWVVLAIGLSFWVLGGFAVKEGRVPWASRYQLPGATFVLLVAAELLRGVRLDRRLLAPALVVVGAAVASNGLFMNEAANSYKHSTEIVRADLTAMEIARETVDPSFFLEEEFADTGFAHIDAGSYFSAVDEFGSPAYTIEELRESSAEARFAADKVLLNALRVAPETAPPSAISAAQAAPASPDSAGVAAVPADGCVAVPGGAESPLLSLPPGGAVVGAGDVAVSDIKMRRFASGSDSPLKFPVDPDPGRPLDRALEDAARRRRGDRLRARTLTSAGFLSPRSPSSARRSGRTSPAGSPRSRSAAASPGSRPRNRRRRKPTSGGRRCGSRRSAPTAARDR